MADVTFNVGSPPHLPESGIKLRAFNVRCYGLAGDAPNILYMAHGLFLTGLAPKRIPIAAYRALGFRGVDVRCAALRLMEMVSHGAIPPFWV